GIHTPSPLQRTCTTWLLNGRCFENAAHVFGAAPVSSRASKVNGPAVIFSGLMGRSIPRLRALTDGRERTVPPLRHNREFRKFRASAASGHSEAAGRCRALIEARRP